MSEMIERVARTIGEAAEKDCPGKFEFEWPFLCCNDANGAFDLRVVARRAIEAMREPTEEMLRRATSESDLAEFEINNAWEDMIDAALSSKTAQSSPAQGKDK